MKPFMFAFLFVFALFPLLTPRPVFAQSGVSLGFGLTEDDMEVYRVGFQYEWPYRWLETGVGSLKGYHEASLNYWNWPEDSDTAFGVFYSPVFKYVFGDGEGVSPYLELGVGMGLISDTKIGGRNMTTAFQFEDRFGVGLDFGGHDIVIRYIHYSNASVKQPNDGMDILLAAYTLRF